MVSSGVAFSSSPVYGPGSIQGGPTPKTTIHPKAEETARVSAAVSTLYDMFPHADRQWLNLVFEMMELHSKKTQDYGPVLTGNLRASEAFGIPAHIGVFLRMKDKMERLQKFARDGKLANESVDDSLMDLANYALLALTLLKDSRLRGSVAVPPGSLPSQLYKGEM